MDCASQKAAETGSAAYCLEMLQQALPSRFRQRLRRPSVIGAVIFALYAGFALLIAGALVAGAGLGYAAWIYAPLPLLLRLLLAAVVGGCGVIGALIALCTVCFSICNAWASLLQWRLNRPLQAGVLDGLDDETLEILNQIVVAGRGGCSKHHPSPRSELRLLSKRRLIHYAHQSLRNGDYYVAHRQADALLNIELKRRTKQLLEVARPGKLTRLSGLAD